jgi:hypothetical protein
MTEGDQPESDLTAEFRRLGENLRNTLHSAWESEERKELMQEIEGGLKALSETVEKAVNEAVESPTGKRVRSDIEDLGERVRSGEIKQELRDEWIKVMRRVNEEIEKVIDDLSPSDPESPEA